MAQRILVQAGVHSAHPEGQYVKYEDFERLKEEFMDYVIRKEKELNTLAIAYKNLTDKNN